VGVIAAVGSSGVPGGTDDQGEFKMGDKVATCVGGMGRKFDGGYAEYCVVPKEQVKRIGIEEGRGLEEVGWDIWGSLPELMQTAWGSLFSSLQLKKGDSLLIRGGTSSIGLAAAALASRHGAIVTSTTRKPSRSQMLLDSGAHEVIIDNGDLFPTTSSRFDKILELIGPTTLTDSFKLLRKGGILCQTGICGGKWILEDFNPSMVLGTGKYFTTYGSTVEAFIETPLDEVAGWVREGKIRIPVRRFRLEEIVEAHRVMEEEGAGAKIVVVVD